MKLTLDEFRQQARPRFGTSNPQPIKVPFWDNQIATGEIAWTGAHNVLGVDSLEKLNNDLNPVWTFYRFGSSRTHLADGRVVCIAGEHEDSYDPDFNIYNDVVVFDPQGNWQVYIYPREEFTPTDFHATVYVEPYIYMIGSLGYPVDRSEQIQLYRIDTRSWAIEKVEAGGAAPPWLNHCLASFDPSAEIIRVVGGRHYKTGEKKFIPNDRERLLDLRSMTWRDGELTDSLPIGPLGSKCANMSAVRNFEEVYELNDKIRQTIGFGHELWSAELWPLYANIGEAIFQVGKPNDRYAICDLAWSESRAEVGHLQCKMIHGGIAGLEAYASDESSYDEFGDFDFRRAD